MLRANVMRGMGFEPTNLRDWTLNPPFAWTFGPRSLDSDSLASAHKLRLDALNCCLKRYKNVKAENKYHMEDSKR